MNTFDAERLDDLALDIDQRIDKLDPAIRSDLKLPPLEGSTMQKPLEKIESEDWDYEHAVQMIAENMVSHYRGLPELG